MKITKPMLAGTCEDVNKIKFPILVTPKLDGIRCISKGSRAISRRFKDIPNKHIQELFKSLPDDLDGELMVPGATFNKISSAVMSEDGTPDVEFWVFDYIKDALTKQYHARMTDLGALALPPFCKKVLPRVCNNMEELLGFEAQVLSQGYEGVMIRSVTSPYKLGRSTEKEGYLLKLKRFEDSEAEILGYEELMHNNNEATKDAFGRTERSSHKENMVPAGMLGALLVKDLKSGIEFKVSTGMTQEERIEYWKSQSTLIGKIIKYRFQPVGVKEKPRFPSWLGFRESIDMGEN